MSDESEFHEVDPEEFAERWEPAQRAVRERPPFTEAEIEAGWREDPGGSGLRPNELTGELGDSSFVHVAPRRPSREHP